MFLAFAVLFPDMTVLLFFIIPVKIKWLAIIDGAFFAIEIVQSILSGNVVGAITPVLALLNFAIFATPHVRYLRQKTQYRHSPGAVNYSSSKRARPITTNAPSAAARIRIIPTCSSAIAASAPGITASARIIFSPTSTSRRSNLTGRDFFGRIIQIVQ